MPPAWKGLDTGRMPHFIGYDQAERMLNALLDRASAWGPEAVAGIARGGLVPASMVASLLALPLAMLSVARGGAVSWLGPAPAGRRLLLIDDACSTGETMLTARAALAAEGRACLTVTIAYDPERSAYVPDLSHPMTELFRFPWERGEATPTSRAARAAGAPPDRGVEAPFFGLDLDGVFLPDLPAAAYAAGLEAALAARGALDPLPHLPGFDPTRAVVITGRPESDRAMTAAWLARCGHGGLPLECRPADLAHDPATVAEYKARAATRWGCTHFVESDAEQAVRIAAAAPHLVVLWWIASERRSVVVGAAG
ncbi:MAG: phosphoribosyltransferase [Proteobacteria bacterium]|nr:phosphoribosyltransferase [Pseudomonadota bacterium]